MSRLKIIICIPIYDDWEAVFLLIPRIDAVLGNADVDCEILLLDDASNDAPPEKVSTPLNNIEAVSILQLRRNLGHQRAIAIGLSHIQATCTCDGVIVMDGDGEDPAGGVEQLIKRFKETDGTYSILAERGRRFEGVGFKFFYVLYRGFFRLLTGHSIKVGNFSLIPIGHLKSLVGVSELWNNYAASIFKAKIPYRLVTIDREPRIAGEPRMNFISLATHGFSAISVFADVLALRLLIITFGLASLTLITLVSIFLLKFITHTALPEWSIFVVGFIVIIFLQAFLMFGILMFITLERRKSLSFLPIRDYPPYVHRIVQLEGSA